VVLGQEGCLTHTSSRGPPAGCACPRPLLIPNDRHGNMQSVVARGQCLCGAIKFAATLPSKWVAHCHCTLCQRAHGAAFVTWVGMDSERVRVIASEGALRWFASPAGGERAFCTHCGSSMFFRSSQWPGELHVARALFTEPVDKEPQAHVYFDTHVSWVALAEDLPTKPARTANGSGASAAATGSTRGSR